MDTEELTEIYELYDKCRNPIYLIDKEQVDLLTEYGGYTLYSTIVVNNDLPISELIFDHQYKQLKDMMEYKEIPLNERIRKVQEMITESTDGRITYD